MLNKQLQKLVILTSFFFISEAFADVQKATHLAARMVFSGDLNAAFQLDGPMGKALTLQPEGGIASPCTATAQLRRVSRTKKNPIEVRLNLTCTSKGQTANYLPPPIYLDENSSTSVFDIAYLSLEFKKIRLKIEDLIISEKPIKKTR